MSMSQSQITIINRPEVVCIAEPLIDSRGLARMAALNHVEREDLSNAAGLERGTAAELCEIAGRNCYKSFGTRRSPKSTSEYIRHIQEIGHLSVLYHAHATFYIHGISRRVLQELVRHYVGCTGTQEGSPSAESTRYVVHPGTFVLPLEYDTPEMRESLERGYTEYREKIEQFSGNLSMSVKSVREAAGRLLPDAAATSVVWTTNPVALSKLLHERSQPGVDAEFRELARVWRNAIPQSLRAFFS